MGFVTYDRSSKITIYKQITTTSCAATCAGMCVKKSPATLKSDGFDIEWADWDGIAAKYKYSTDTGSTGLSGIISILKSGYPVIVKVNNTSAKQHWVVVTKFSGEETNPVTSNFTCADPWTGTSVTLDNALNMAGVYVTRYYY